MWQECHFKIIIVLVLAISIISCVDVFEKYTTQVQNEIQSMHQHNFQIRNLFSLDVQTQPCACTNSDTPKLIKDLHYYILDDIFS
jgi:hypothetical protein